MTESQKIFTKKAILWGTFLGGPLVAGFLMHRNYKLFGEYYAAQRTLILSIFFTIVLFSILLLIPDYVFDKIPRVLIPIVYTGIIEIIVNKTQKRQIEEYVKNGGKKASGWETFGYGILGTILILIFMFPFIIGKPLKGYEKELLIAYNTRLYFSKAIDSEIPEKIAEAIKQTEFLDLKSEQDLFLKSEANYYILKIVLPDMKVISDSAVLSDFNYFQKALNKITNLNKKIVIKFTNPRLTETADLPPSEIKIPELKQELVWLQRYSINKIQTIFYNSSVPGYDITTIAGAIKRLESYFPSDKPFEMIFLDKGDYYEAKFFTSPPLLDGSYYYELKSSIRYFKTAGINKQVKLFIIDNTNFNEKEIFSY